MPRKDSNVEATQEADYQIGTEGATGHPNMRFDIKLNYHRAVISSASSSRAHPSAGLGAHYLGGVGRGGVWAASVMLTRAQRAATGLDGVSIACNRIAPAMRGCEMQGAGDRPLPSDLNTSH